MADRRCDTLVVLWVLICVLGFFATHGNDSLEDSLTNHNRTFLKDTNFSSHSLPRETPFVGAILFKEGNQTRHEKVTLYTSDFHLTPHSQPMQTADLNVYNSMRNLETVAIFHLPSVAYLSHLQNLGELKEIQFVGSLSPTFLSHPLETADREAGSNFRGRYHSCPYTLKAQILETEESWKAQAQEWELTTEMVPAKTFGAQLEGTSQFINIPGRTWLFQFVFQEKASTCAALDLQMVLAELDGPKLSRKIWMYFVFTFAILATQIRLLCRQSDEVAETPSYSHRISLLTLGVMAFQDVVFVFFHLYMNIHAPSPQQKLYFPLALCQFCFFSFMEVRFFLLVWRHKIAPDFADQGWEHLRRQISLLWFKFYGCLLAGLLLVFNFRQYVLEIAMVLQLYWVPQILHNAYHGQRHPFHPSFTLGMSYTRTALVLYWLTCPKNALDGLWYDQVERLPSTFFGFYTLSIQMLQVGLMMAQLYFGGRCFIPRSFMPSMYNYYRLLPTVEEECVICMCDFEKTDKVVVTPCNHQFHEHCLMEWIDIKMECPSCRANLPPFG